MQAGASSPDGDTNGGNVSWSFESRSIGLQFQKKFLSSLSGRRLARNILDEATCQVLDNVYRILREFYGSKKQAESRMRDIIKIIVKLSLLVSTNQFDSIELNIFARFRERFRVLGMTIVSFYRVDYTYDRGYLLGLLRECERLLLQLKVRHLSDRSQTRIEDFFTSIGSPDLLDALFKERSYSDMMGNVVNGLDKLVEQGII